MIEYILLSLVKVLDNIILTAKSIATYKEERVLSSVLVIISQLIFYLVINQVINDNIMLAIIVVSISSGIGNYIAFIINDKFKKDAKWTMVFTSSDYNDLKKFCEYLKYHKIKYIVCNGYNRDWIETMNIIAFSKTKEESRLIEKYLNTTNSKYLKEII